jgi:hypothetical protein
MLAAALCVAQATSPVEAQDPNNLFSDSVGVAAASLQEPASRSRLVRFDSSRLFAVEDRSGRATAVDRVTLNLFSDVIVTAVLDRVENGADGFRTWLGHPADDDRRLVSLTWRDGVLAGTVQSQTASYVLRPVGNGLTRIVEVDASAAPQDGEPLTHAAIAPVRPPAVQDDGSTIDVLVLFTRAVRNALGGGVNVAAWVNQQIANANSAFGGSQVVPRLRLVGVRDAEQGGSNDVDTDLDRLTATNDGYFDEIHDVRNAVKADLVHLVVASATGACGVAHLMQAGQNDVGFGVYAFSVGVYSCDYKFTFAHELGHNMGANHAPGDPVSATPLAAYAFGYKDAAGGFRTLMAYPCEYPGSGDAVCPRVARVSNPLSTLFGRTTGSAGQDNARAFNEVRATIANFRTNSPGALPGIPAAPTATVGGGNVVTIAWSPPAGSAPTSYRIEGGRSAGAKDLGETTVAATQLSLQVPLALGRYFVRVRAGNAQGFGAASDDVQVQVGPTAIPNAPTGLSASVSGNSVTFTWTAPAQPPSITGYIVEAGAAPGGVAVSLNAAGTSYTASGPDGLYYARVRAVNELGAGPASNEVSFRLGVSAPPGAPTNLVAALRQSRVDLSWTAPAAGGPVEGYIVEAGSSSGASNLLNARVGNVLTFGATAPNGRYYVRVRAYNRAGSSPPSNEVVVVPDGTACAGDISATLAWNTPTDLDLHVIEPNGTHVYYSRKTGTTARLDRDNTSGYGPENICVAAGTALAGFYEFFVVAYSGSAWPTTATITVRTRAGTSSEQFRTFTRVLSASNRTLGVKVAAVDGRGNQIVDLTGTRVPPADLARTSSK